MKLFNIFKKKPAYPILDKYGVEFKLVKDSDMKYLTASEKCESGINFCICGFFIHVGTGILPGADTFLFIGASTPRFETANAAVGTETIPTQDIKEFIEASIDWIVSNRFEKLYWL